MQLTRLDVHELKNQLAISIGMIELVQKMLNRDGKEAELQKIIDRLEKALTAQKKLLDFFENSKSATTENY
jgi:hypothetical protein